MYSITPTAAFCSLCLTPLFKSDGLPISPVDNSMPLGRRRDIHNEIKSKRILIQVIRELSEKPHENRLSIARGTAYNATGIGKQRSGRVRFFGAQIVLNRLRSMLITSDCFNIS
ncbi:hypothetical protein ElyMa_001888300 [Elysia marginata]|uniref:Uncharacterized protein n=1 Tax=Elysia marginata TaxID=1093978 RepID=A0AAV4EQD8_9GAST|nr:hypothetical protein ElyMa_001888300 [Elysia marginata]